MLSSRLIRFLALFLGVAIALAACAGDPVTPPAVVQPSPAVATSAPPTASPPPTNAPPTSAPPPTATSAPTATSVPTPTPNPVVDPITGAPALARARSRSGHLWS